MFGLFRDIQRISGCKVDVDRSAIGSFQERKIVMRGTSKQVRYFLSDLCYLSFFLLIPLLFIYFILFNFS